MMNNVENKNDLNKMSELEFGKNKVEMMRYRDNSLSYKLGFGGLAFSILACFVCLNSFNPHNVMTIFAIMLNVVILLGGFLCIEKSKAYSFGGSIGLVVFGAICGARIFWIPLQIMLKNEEYLGMTITTDNKDQLTYLPTDGTFRAVLAIIFLVAAAALFIAAGYIGMQRSRKLTTYLNSINNKKVGGN